MKKKGLQGPDYQVVEEIKIDEERISEKELDLIETIKKDIIKMISDNKRIGEE